MTYWVLRQAAPEGKSALADEATLIAMSHAAVEGKVRAGLYLEWSNPDAKHGMGDERWTDDLKRAKRFSSMIEALECWKAQSTIRPLRPDGRPNRPLTAYTVEPQAIHD